MPEYGQCLSAEGRRDPGSVQCPSLSLKLRSVLLSVQSLQKRCWVWDSPLPLKPQGAAQAGAGGLCCLFWASAGARVIDMGTLVVMDYKLHNVPAFFAALIV